MSGKLMAWPPEARLSLIELALPVRLVASASIVAVGVAAC